MDTKKYKPIIGLEVHVELKTESKMFCSCSADYFGQKPNTHTCPVCLGLPGALPVPNKKAIEWCIMIGQALNCNISGFSKFDRKNYFYPDLPKGYQISQYDQPFCEKGFIEISNGKKIGITRVHMEEDTAKLMHQFSTMDEEQRTKNDEGFSLIDFNRSGVPLVEIVTEPDFESAAEVKEYLQKLQQIVRYLGVSNADMEKGDMRLEPNISVQEVRSQKSKVKSELPNYKVEVKNINSFKFVEKAIDYEIKRHIELLEKGQTPAQETRGWDEKKQKTVSQRSKEEAKDYRYFPEPDIPPIRYSKNQILKIKNNMPELPNAKFDRFKKEYGLPDYDVEILTREIEIANYFEEAVKASQIANHKLPVTTKQIANWIIHKKPDLNTILPTQLIQTILSAKQITTIDEKELEKIIDQVLEEHSKAIEDYKKGKENVMQFLIGQILRLAKRRIKVDIIREAIIKKIK